MPNGWIASSNIIEDTLDAITGYRKWYKKNKVSNKITNNLITQVKKWVDKGINVYAFTVPTSWSMKQLEDSLSGYNETEISKRIENVGGIWLKFNDNYHSYDGSHLVKESAEKLSRELAKKIKQ